MPATKKTTKKATTKKPVAKKPAVKKAPVKKTVAKKTPAKQAPVKNKESKLKSTIKKDIKIAKNTATKVSKIVKDEIKKVESAKWYKEAVLMFLNPKKFFQSCQKNASVNKSIYLAGIYGLVAAVIKIILSIGSIKLISAVTYLAAFPALSIISAFSISGIVMLLSHICKGKYDFTKALYAVSHIMILFPISLIIFKLSFTYYVLFSTSFLIDLAYIYMIYNIIAYTLESKLVYARIFLYALAVVLIGFYLSDNSLLNAKLLLNNSDVYMDFIKSNLPSSF